MIKVAQFDANEGKQCRPMTQYARKDYVSLHLVAGFVTGTICYGILLGLWGLYSAEWLLAEINSLDIQEFIKSILLFYVIFMVIYLGLTYTVFHIKYTVGRRKVRKYYGSLKKVNQLYDREERLKMTGTKEWDE